MPARITRVDRGAYDVLTDDEPLRVLALPRGPDSAVATVGDRVLLDDERTRAVALLPRTSLLARGAASGHSAAQPLAANVDAVLLCFGLHVPVPVPRLEQLLVLAWDSGAEPVVVLTKADLCDDVASVRAQVARAAPGVVVAVVSATTGDVAELGPYATAGTTLVLLGASGAGKSTLVNALAGTEVMATGEVRATDGEGRHTTSHRELVVLPGGAVVIDTPGLREVAVRAGEDAVARTFPDVEELVARCRFRDCGHGTEPGCAVREAVAQGALPAERFASWEHLQREVAFQARRTDARLRAEERARWKRVSRQQRARGGRP